MTPRVLAALAALLVEAVLVACVAAADGIAAGPDYDGLGSSSLHHLGLHDEAGSGVSGGGISGKEEHGRRDLVSRSAAAGEPGDGEEAASHAETAAKLTRDKLLGISWETERYTLAQIDPQPGQRGVRSELAEVVFTFANVTAKKGLPVVASKAPLLLRYAVALALASDSGAPNATQGSLGAEIGADGISLTLKAAKARNGGGGKLSTSVKLSSANTEVILDHGSLLVRTQLPKDLDLSYDATYRLALSPSAWRGLSPLLPSREWAFTTESRPKDPGASTEVDVRSVGVLGLGVFVLDVADVDIRKGVFSTDLQIFLLEYYIDFADTETALREAMHGNRTCKDALHGEKFQFIRGASPAHLLSKLNFINTVSKPTPELVFGREAPDVFDHFRVRASWRFSPGTENYPFQAQELPVKIEIAGESVTREPTALICSLDTFSGFAYNLSSLSVESARAQGARSTYTAGFTVSENNRWPPLEGRFVPPYRYPHDHHVARQPTRTSSRLEWVITLHRPVIVGALEIAPAMFVASSALVSYVLPTSEFRTKISTCTTAMLAAVVQHSSIRSRIPERSAVTVADLVMLVVYTLILMATLSAVLVAALASHRRYGIHAERVNALLRVCGLCSPLLFLVFPLGGGRDLGSWAGSFFLVVLSSVVADRFAVGRPGVARLAACFRGPGSVLDKVMYQSLDPEPAPAVREWSAGRVAHWIEALYIADTTRADMKRYADLFFRERIDGASLGRISTDTVKGLGIPLGHSLKISDAVQELIAATRPEAVEPRLSARKSPTTSGGSENDFRLVAQGAERAGEYESSEGSVDSESNDLMSNGGQSRRRTRPRRSRTRRNGGGVGIELRDRSGEQGHRGDT